MKPKLSISHTEGRAEQEYSLKVVEGFMLGNARYTVYESSNFFGYPVTVGVEEMTGKDQEDREHYQVTVKVAVCSPEDTYKPEIGRSLVLGRLMQSEVEGISFTNIDDDTYQDMAESYVEKRVGKLVDYLLNRDMANMMNKINQKATHSMLEQEFQEFK